MAECANYVCFVTVWIGGTGDGGLHERTPYWLNGILPLAFQLRNAGIDRLPPVVGIYKVVCAGYVLDLMLGAISLL